jgi:hypothetical protein
MNVSQCISNPNVLKVTILTNNPIVENVFEAGNNPDYPNVTKEILNETCERSL